MSDPDIGIIGAGIDWRGAAATLSAMGRRGLVPERDDRPGGGMRPNEVALSGFNLAERLGA